MLKNDVPFSLSTECKEAFDLLYNVLILALVLAYPDSTLTFYIQIDAYLYAAGAVLFQVSLDNVERPIANCSCTLNRHKRNYIVIKCECLDDIFALKQF